MADTGPLSRNEPASMRTLLDRLRQPDVACRLGLTENDQVLAYGNLIVRLRHYAPAMCGGIYGDRFAIRPHIGIEPLRPEAMRGAVRARHKEDQPLDRGKPRLIIPVALGDGNPFAPRHRRMAKRRHIDARRLFAGWCCIE